MITANAPANRDFPPFSELLRIRLPDLSILEVYELTKHEPTAERAFIDYRWPLGVRCPTADCGSLDVRECRGYKRANQLPVQFACKACGRRFNVRIGYFLEGSPLCFTEWLWALYFVVSTAECEPITPAALMRQIGVTWDTAKFMIRRIQNHI